MVSSLTAIPNRWSSRSPSRPPKACPTRCTTRHTDPCGGLAPPRRPPTVGEHRCGAVPVLAPSPRDMRPQHDGSPLGRQIPQRAPVSAMAGRAWPATTRTSSDRGSFRLHHYDLRGRGGHAEQGQVRRIRQPLVPNKNGPGHSTSLMYFNTWIAEPCLRGRAAYGAGR